MMRRKNLERAVVLGLLLSTSVYGSAWAEDIQSGGLWTDANKEIEAGDNLIITTNSIGVGFNGMVNVKDGDLTINAGSNGVESGYTETAQVNILANNIIINSGANGIFTSKGEGGIFSANRGYVIIGEKDGRKIDSLTIVADGQGIDNKKGKTEIYGSDDSIIDIRSTGNGGINPNQAAVNNEGSGDNGIVTIEGGSIKLTADTGNGITNSSGTTTLTSKKVIVNADVDGIRNSSGKVFLNTAGQNSVSAESNGVNNTSRGTIDISAQTSNIITAKETGILAKNGVVNITAGTNNALNAGNIIENVENKNILYGDSLAVKAGNESKFGNLDLSTSGIVNLTSNNGYNYISGAVYANVKDTNVTIKGTNDTANNYVYSAAVIDGAGDLTGKTTTDNGDGTFTTTGMDVVSALYAEEGAEINLSGVNDIRTYYGDPNDEHTSERAVWAYKGANITLDGTTNISTYKYEVSPENRDIAIAAGTATELTDKDFEKDVLDNLEIANVNLNYQAGSSISGDILAAYGGEVNIKDNNITTASVGRSGAATGINITGDLLAGNTGKLTVDLGNGGNLTGRADDYGDASTEHITLYNPAFSSNIIQGGDVTLNMGDGSQWNVQGQSWITNVNAIGNVLIDLTSAENEYKNYDSHALTIRNLNGDANIKMDLNGDRSQSDMLYIGQGNGEYNIELAELVTVDDMYAQLDNNTKFSGLRFATVGAGSDVKFNVTAKDQGFNNVIYTVDTDVYNSAESAHENNAYNGENMTEEKPGNSLVDDLLNGKQNASTESGIATLAANDVMLLADENDTENDNKTQHLNYKLVDMQSDGPTDAGKTMLNMSLANYSNAIYMDRLNKRLGEARYINDDPEEDEGMWVRIRHDRIGKEDAFRSQNTMYELGYDKRQECDNGKRRVGFAVDYMHGDTGYSDIAGKGEIDRYGLWLYDTWTGNKGHYADYVAKWGHLQNDFEVYTMTGGEKVTGDYSNNVFSISAEYGRKKDMGNDWYIEPQAQLQLARVTGADYTTSQGTKVSVDGINSLIGRAGFRLGKDFGEEKQSTVYFKADVLHEFLGDQTIRAMDGTTDGWQTVDYENKGTWYDIGIGYAAMLSQSTYAFIDLEQSFGNDNDDTYQINAGVRWTF